MPVNLGQAINQGLALRQSFDQRRQQNQMEDLRGQLNFNQPLQSQSAFQQMAAINPQMASQLRSTLKTDEQGFDAAFQDAAVFKNIYSRDPQQGIAFLQNRIQMGESQGRDMFLTKDLLATAMRNPQEAISEVDSFLSIPQQMQGQKQTNFAPEISPVQTDPETGQKFIIRTDKNTGEVKRINAEGALGETTSSQEERLVRRELIKDATAESKAAFEGLKNIKSNLGTIDEAVAAIDKGASSGVIENFFPSFTEATVALENTANRMGLDVISATTFGALSEGELKLAMNTAMPRNLKSKALKKWLTDRKKAQQKLGRELRKMAITLGKGKTTIAEYLEQNATFQSLDNQQGIASPLQPQSTIGRFQIEVQ